MTEYKNGMELGDVVKLAIKVLNKSMDTTTPNAEKMEFYVLSRPDSRPVVCVSKS